MQNNKKGGYGQMTDLKEMSYEELMGHLTNNLAWQTQKSIKESKFYESELLSRYAQGEKAIKAMEQIGEVVYNSSGHEDISNEVTGIYREYIK
jgi:hypothetical protein